MKKILIIDEVHEVLTKGLTDLGYEVFYQPELTREDLILSIEKYDGLVVRTKTNIDESVLCKAVKLKFIARAGSGVDNIDTDYCDAHNIMYFNSGEANADAVGEQTVGMMLCLFANIMKADAEVRQFIWDREGNRGLELKGKTVAIIGYGNTGKAVAKKLSGFEVNILAYDKYLSGYSDSNVCEANMDEIFEKADVVTFHLPLTKETQEMVNTSFLNRFRKSIFLLNLSRGKVVKLNDW
jgi:D-3-phosphoglycerate dehydrogenase